MNGTQRQGLTWNDPRQCKSGEVYARGADWVQGELMVWATVSVFALDAENFNVEAKTNAEKKQLRHITDDTIAALRLNAVGN